MALPRTPSSWISGIDMPTDLLTTGRDDYELYEQEDEFVLTIEMPGFDTDEITVAWDDGVLNIAAEHEDETRGQRKTYHRRFRFPKHVYDEDIVAEYTNGVLEVRLPIEAEATASGKEIEVQS
jgi:HSP20 family protein